MNMKFGMPLERPHTDAGKMEKSPHAEAKYWSDKALRETRPEDREQLRNHEAAVIESDGDKIRVIWWVKKISGRVAGRNCVQVIISHPDETVDILKWENNSWHMMRSGNLESPPLEPGEAEQDKLPGDAW